MKFVLLLAAATLCLAQKPDFIPIPGHAFTIGRTEVTVAQFSAFVKQTAYKTAAEAAGAPRNWRAPGYKTSRNQPVVYVTFEDARRYCEFAGARLPTDEEWLLAARAGSATRHYWGESIDGRFLWYRPNSGGHPHDVARKKPNAFGLYDMEGNVWEWTALPPEQGEPAGCRRGGSWIDCENIDSGPGKPPSPLISLDVRYPVPLKYQHRYDDIGFRCAR